MKKYLSFLLFATLGLTARAQQDAMLSQYMFNGLFINPAYAGTHEYFSSSLVYRSQWVGIQGAPQTATFAVDGPVANDKMGLGLMVSHDEIGVTNQTDVYANYNYKLQLGKGKLCFGLKAGASSYRANVTQLTYWDAGDQVYNADIHNYWVPKFGFGTYYYTKTWYAGFSIPTLIAYDKNYAFGMDVEKSSYLRRHYYLTGGYVFTLNSTLKLKPSLLFKYEPAAPAQVDLNLSLIMKDALIVGVSYRTGDAVLGIIEYQANNRVRIGYSYDYTLSKLSSYSHGSHEILLGIDFGKQIIQMKTPRFF